MKVAPKSAAFVTEVSAEDIIPFKAHQRKSASSTIEINIYHRNKYLYSTIYGSTHYTAVSACCMQVSDPPCCLGLTVSTSGECMEYSRRSCSPGCGSSW